MTLVIARGWVTKNKLDELLKPANITHPRLALDSLPA